MYVWGEQEATERHTSTTVYTYPKRKVNDRFFCPFPMGESNGRVMKILPHVNFTYVTLIDAPNKSHVMHFSYTGVYNVYTLVCL